MTKYSVKAGLQAVVACLELCKTITDLPSVKKAASYIVHAAIDLQEFTIDSNLCIDTKKQVLRVCVTLKKSFRQCRMNAEQYEQHGHQIYLDSAIKIFNTDKYCEMARNSLVAIEEQQKTPRQQDEGR